MKNTTLFLLLSLVLFSCKSEKTTDFDKMAEELCACMTPLVKLNDQVQDLSAAGDTEGVADLYAELEAEFARSEKCATDLEEKYGAMNAPEEEAKAQAALRKNCPKVAALINQEEVVE